jgi:hypothetical protein
MKGTNKMLEHYLRIKLAELEEKSKRCDISDREAWACRYVTDTINAVLYEYEQYLEQVEISKLWTEMEEN